MWTWIKTNWKKSVILMAIGYMIHIVLEAIVVNTIAALFGIKLPSLIPMPTEA
jgi:hypothetical protein